MSENLCISAIIPVYNGKKYLLDAINSVISQTLPPIELIVVDDGSTDGSMSLLEGIEAPFPIIKVSQQNAGQSAARNHGSRLAKGDYIALLDQDDIWYPEHLNALANQFLKSSDTRLAWVYSNMDEIDEQGLMIRYKILSSIPVNNTKTNIDDLLGCDIFVLPSSSLIKLSALNDIGMFDEQLSGYEDDDLFLRMFRAGYTHAYIKQPLSKWRLYGSSSSYSPRMNKSRRIYAKKLGLLFPDDAQMHRNWMRDRIAPRFFNNVMDSYNRAFSLNDWNACLEMLSDVLMFANLTDIVHIGRKQRLSFKLMARPRLYKKLLAIKDHMPFFLKSVVSKLIFMLSILLPAITSPTKSTME